MTLEVVGTYRGYEIVAIWACGEIQGYMGNSITPATRFYTPAAQTMEEIKEQIDKSWEIRYANKKAEYKTKYNQREKTMYHFFERYDIVDKEK